MTGNSVDLNSDLGEGYGAYRIADDSEILKIVSSANVACGFHGGDPEIMVATFRMAKTQGVAVGAHPGFPDVWGFGRRVLPFTASEIEHLVAYQIGAAMALATLAGHRVTHVKAHGALGNLAGDDAGVAEAVARAVKAVDKTLVSLVIAGTEGERAADRQGLRAVREIFADRTYTDRGTLMPRSEPGAVIRDADVAGRRVLEMLDAGAVISHSGKRTPVAIESICIHSDTPDAVRIARGVRTALETAGITVQHFAV